MGLDPDQHPCAAYLAYIDLLSRWNKAYSLTAIRGANEIMSRHVLDALSILPYVQGQHCLDVGTGAGLPGLILALANPGQHWVLLDSNSKKVRFLTHAVMELGIRNAEVVRARAEDYHADVPFTTITARAFAVLGLLYERTWRLLAQDGSLLAMKGPVTPELNGGIAELGRHGVVVQIHELAVPGVDGRRTLLELRHPDQADLAIPFPITGLSMQ
ncbi:MAG: 16S rRNA (guanine(527)-N(7))-methyltransferase RsmG [Gammaproteobacteria bacterium RBG_16_51_14]|nr:MAG: 16S rRNA (guanine(527)-N(7))-methyltransferase RsmG [Gammaproteobacteria bacterium RBG_16_51_14]